jgi:hypothetical protein
MAEEIITYRVGDHFLCPKCYQRSVKILSVHNIELPAQSIKKGDIENFVCQQCEDMNKLANGEEEKNFVYFEERIDVTGLMDKVNSAFRDFTESEKHIKAETDMIGEITQIRRKGKFIEKTLRRAYEGRPLSRKNIVTLRNFFNNFGEKLDTLRTMITINILTNIDYRQILAEQARRNFCALAPKEQEIMRKKFDTTKKCSQNQEYIVGEMVRC